MRKEFTMTKEQCEKLLDACKPVPYMVVGGVEPRSPQENANDAWCALGREMGFDGMTVRPVAGKGIEVFTAEVVQLVEGQLIEAYKGYAITVAPEDKRCGFATTVLGCKEQIDELEDIGESKTGLEMLKDLETEIRTAGFGQWAEQIRKSLESLEQ